MDFDRYFDAGSLAPFSTARRGGGTTGVRLVHVAAPAHDGDDPATEDLVLGLMLRSRGAARWRWDAARANEAKQRKSGTLGLTPPGAAARFEVCGPSEMLIVALPLIRLRQTLAGELTVPSDFGKLHDVYADHQHVRNLCLRLWRAAGSGGTVSDLLVEALAEQILIELTLTSTGQTDFPRPAGRFSNLELARVHEKAREPNTNVHALALACGLPLRTFRRNFTTTVGASPHRWLMQTRLERAAEALYEGKQSIAEIAFGEGFASQSHLTALFSSHFGVSPKQYRQMR